MIEKKTVLALSLATAIALPAPGLTQTYTPSYPPYPDAGNNGTVAAVILTAMVVALTVMAFSQGDTGGTMSMKDGKTDPYTGRTTGPVLMDF
jgi:hypothetical protein